MATGEKMAVGTHITHEAVRKIGGIGAVINGLINSPSYLKKFNHSLLYAPLFNREGKVEDRLGPNSELLYSGLDKIDTGGYQQKFKKLEEKYQIKFIYGKKQIISELNPDQSVTVDILLVDIFDMKEKAVDQFKYEIWDHFAIQSDTYKCWDYEQYLRISIPFMEIVKVLYGNQKAVHFSHEYMGVACVMAVLIAKKKGRRKADKTIFYAHEVATARHIVEHHPGHDTMFYNVIEKGIQKGISLEEEFGSQSFNPRNELIKAMAEADYIFAVGDYVKKEYQFLVPQADSNRIKIVYNGIIFKEASFEEKVQSKEILSQYCHTLYNFKPDFVFSHVTRMLNSKGLWRDIKFLYYLDKLFTQKKIKGFYILLSSLLGYGRPPQEIRKMEKNYGWPVLHRKGYPDLEGDEEHAYNALEIFNAKSKSIKGVYINQFGFDRKRCGNRMPKDASLLNLRAGSDLEFGLSVYEPFGIAQLETFPYGGIPLLSQACGSAFLLEKAFSKDPDTFYVVDYAKIPSKLKSKYRKRTDYKIMSISDRDLIEEAITQEHSKQVFKLLIKADKNKEDFFHRTQQLAQELTWESRLRDTIEEIF